MDLELNNEEAKNIISETKNCIKDTKIAIQQAFKTHKQYYDWRHTLLLAYKISDYISIRPDRHPVTIMEHSKLSTQKLPSYKITQISSNGRVLELDLPPSLNIHPVVLVQNIEPEIDLFNDPFKRVHPHPEPLKGCSKNFEASIVDHKWTPVWGIKYRIHYKGFSPENDEWYYARPNYSKIDKVLVDAYHQQAFVMLVKTPPMDESRQVDTLFPDFEIVCPKLDQ